ncbi:MAG: hypothetical protein ABIG34_04835 [Candidatus Peregrinibacteria bacterium]
MAGIQLFTSSDRKKWQVHKYFIVGVLLLACMKELWDVAWRMSIEFHTTICCSGVAYMISGRGILNGLIPYKDLLDVKAPGVIFLAALSQLITGDERFIWILQIIVLLAVPAIMMILAYRETRTFDWFERWTLIALSFLVGSAFMLYEVERAGRFETESFGIFFALLYLLVIAWDRQRMSYLRLGLTSLLMLCTIGMKEPFLFILLAMNLLLSRDIYCFLRSFLIPLIISLLAGVLMLAALGYLWPYLTIYLPIVIAARLPSDHGLLFRGIIIIRVLKDVAWFSPVPMLGYAIFYLWAIHPFFKFQERWKYLILSVVSIVLLASLSHFSTLYWQLIEQLHYTFPLKDAFFIQLTLKYVALLAGMFISLWILFFRSRELFRGVLLSSIAGYLVIFAIGSGDFHLNHYLLAIPAYAAIFLIFVGNRNRTVLARTLFYLAIIPIVLIPFYHPKLQYDKKLQEAKTQFQAMQKSKVAAKYADELMDRCNLTQYSSLSTASSITPFTKHSPTDLGFTQSSFAKDHPELRKRFLERLEVAPIVFVPSNFFQTNEDKEVADYLQYQTTTKPPSCAENIELDREDISPLFKKVPSQAQSQ